MMNAQLRQIADLIKSRRFDQARQMLEGYLEQHPDDAWAWYLRSFVEPSHAGKTAAADRALALAPDSEPMQARLARLQAAQPAARRPARRCAWLAAFAVVAIIVVAVLALRSGQQPPDAPLSTLAVLAMPTQLAAETTSVTENQSTEATSANLPASVEATVNAQPETPANLLPSDLPPIVPGVPTATAVSQNVPTQEAGATASTDLPSDNSTATLPLRPTRAGSTPVVSPTPIPITATPAFGSITEPGVPVNMALNIGAGEMRIVSVTRPAEAYVAELGGSVPNAPADQGWVLVEALLICTDDRSCIPNPSALWLLGSSGSAYRSSPQLNLTPIFGSILSNHQVWGYLGFVVPENENNLRLVLVQAGETYVFALQ